MPPPSAPRVERFPWEPESVNRANLTTASLRQLLQGAYPPRSRDAASLLAAAGALVGFAAQNSALEQGELLTARRDLVAPESLMLRRSKSGHRFLAGRWIDAPLLLGYGHGFPLQRMVIQAAAAAGVQRADFSDYWEMERRVAKAAADGALGDLQPGDGRAHGPRELLRKLWPTARRIMTAPMPLEMADEPMMSEAHWPIAMAVVAARMIALTAETGASAQAADLVMEGALIASKLDPDSVDPGRCSLAPGPRGLQIARDDRKRMARRIA